MLAKIFLICKKIHRILVLLTLFLTLVMATTGSLLKYPALAEGIVNLGFVRYLHNELSAYFAITLSLMALTGIYMFIFPYLNKPAAPPSNPDQKN